MNSAEPIPRCAADHSGPIGINRDQSIGIKSDQSGSHRINLFQIRSKSINRYQSGSIGINQSDSNHSESNQSEPIGINRDQSIDRDQSGSISINRDVCAIPGIVWTHRRFSQFLEFFFLLSEIFLNFRNKWKVGVFLFLFIDELLLCAALRWTRWDENALNRHIRIRTSPQMQHLTRVYQSVTFEFGQVCRCDIFPRVPKCHIRSRTSPQMRAMTRSQRILRGKFQTTATIFGGFERVVSKDRSRSYRGRISQQMRIFSKNSKKNQKKFKKKFEFFLIFF